MTMKTVETGVLRIPEVALRYFKEETKDQTNDNPTALVPWGTDKKDWPMAITKGMIEQNNQSVRFVRIAYTDIAKQRIQQGFVSEHVVIKDDTKRIGYTVPIEWIEIK